MHIADTLQSSAAQQSSQQVFFVQTKQRTYVLRARSTADRDSWILAVAKQAALVKERELLVQAEQVISQLALSSSQRTEQAFLAAIGSYSGTVRHSEACRDLFLDFVRGCQTQLRDFFATGRGDIGVGPGRTSGDGWATPDIGGLGVGSSGEQAGRGDSTRDVDGEDHAEPTESEKRVLHVPFARIREYIEDVASGRESVVLSEPETHALSEWLEEIYPYFKTHPLFRQPLEEAILAGGGIGARTRPSRVDIGVQVRANLGV